MVNADNESNMLDRGKMGGSILITSFHLYFLKLHSYNYTLPPLIRRRNRGVIFFIHTPFTLFSPLFLGKILGPGLLVYFTVSFATQMMNLVLPLNSAAKLLSLVGLEVPVVQQYGFHRSGKKI